MSSNPLKSVSFDKFFQTRRSAACVFCGRRPEETKSGEFFATCRACHRQELDALAAFSRGDLKYGQLKQVPVTAATILSRGIVEMLVRSFNAWSPHVAVDQLRDWLDSPAVYKTWRGSVFEQFVKKMELASKAIDAAAKAAPAPAPEAPAEPTPEAAPALEQAKPVDAPAPAEPIPVVAEGTVVQQPAPDINALSEGELEALTAPEPAAVPEAAPAPEAEPAMAKKARAKRAKKS